MDYRAGNKILYSNMHSASVGGGSPSIVPGKIGAALQLNAEHGDFVDLGSYGSDSCFCNLSACVHGLTAAVWLRLDALRDNMHLLSTGVGGLLLYYRFVWLPLSSHTNLKIETWLECGSTVTCNVQEQTSARAEQ